MHRRLLLLVPLVSCLILASCGSLQRAPAVPPDATDRVVLLDEPALRTWGDFASRPFVTEIEAVLGIEVRNQRSQGNMGRLRTSHLLAISGGGSYGAFGAGILCGWTERGDRPSFDIVTGISTGALTAPFAFLGPAYDEKLRTVYTTVTTADVIAWRGIFDALFEDSAFYSDPLRRMMEELIDEPMLAEIAAEYAKGRLLLVGTTNLDANRGVIWNMGLIARASAQGDKEATKLFHDVLMASAAIPGAFPPVMIDVEVDGKQHQEMHVDGGTKTQVFLYPPSFDLIAESRARGVERDRVAFVLRNARQSPLWEEVPRRTHAVARRAISGLIHTQGRGDLFRIYSVARRDEMDFNLALIPDSFTETSDDHFDPVFMSKLFKLGYDSARSDGGYPWLKSPPGWADGLRDGEASDLGVSRQGL